ncbi:MAG: hypothetical protein K2X69_07650 [Silvanigrellaceae bacterium]|nr:hypothetical protein [Silvanigrellaceae bacterium]
MQLTQKQIKQLDLIKEEDANTITKAYKNSVIADIKYSAPRSNPDNKHAYAVIKNEVGETIVSATLDYCAQRLIEVAYLKSKFNIS